MARYQQRCVRCKKNLVLMIRPRQFPLCVECEMKELSQAVTDPVFVELFALEEKFYRENSFLRDIKRRYLRFGALSDKQIETFKKVVKELQQGISQEKPPKTPKAKKK